MKDTFFWKNKKDTFICNRILEKSSFHKNNTHALQRSMKDTFVCSQIFCRYNFHKNNTHLLLERLTVVTMALVDSEVAFQKRCDELEENLFTLLKAQSISNYSTLAFVLGSPQAQVQDAGMNALADRVFGAGHVLGQVSMLRRIHFEACTFVMADMRTQISGVDASEPVRKLPFFEKQNRLEQQKSRITGLLHKPEQQPAHTLIDVVFNMMESGAITYIAPSKCHSREQEVQSEAKSKSKQIVTLEQGALKTFHSATLSDVDTTTELRLFFAFQRRHLAFELNKFLSWELCQQWVDKLMSSLTSDAPSNCQAVSLTQILRADREMFSILAAEHEGGLQAKAGEKPPLDKTFKRLLHDPRINVHLIAMPKQVSSGQPKRPNETTANSPAKQPTKKQRPNTDRVAPQLPPELKGLKTRTTDNKPICWHKNLKKGCTNPVKNNGCRYGFHVCMKCLQSGHGAADCPQLWLGSGVHQPQSVNHELQANQQVADGFPRQDSSPAAPFSATDDPVQLFPQDRKSPSSQIGLVVEIFSGTGRLTKTCRDFGLRATAVDKDLKRSENVVTACFDVTKPDQLKNLETYLQAERSALVHAHFAPSCGTASRAREKPIPGLDFAKQPKPLRSETFPDGLHDLRPTEQNRVNEANASYTAMVHLVLLLLSFGVAVSIENPRNSLFWLTSMMAQLVVAYPNGFFTDFQHCMHGGCRDKWTRFWSFNPRQPQVNQMASLALTCDRSHAHKSWKPMVVDGKMIYPTAEEAAYPWLLCQRMATIFFHEAVCRGLAPPETLLDQLDRNTDVGKRVIGIGCAMWMQIFIKHTHSWKRDL